MSKTIELRHTQEWLPQEPYRFRVYWLLKSKWANPENMPHLMTLVEMEDYIKDQGLDAVEHYEFYGQYKNWDQCQRAGYRFAREEDAMLFWLRFNGVENV